MMRKRKKFDFIDLFVVVGCLFISIMVFLIIKATDTI